MASQVILKKSSVAARVPVVGDLAFGELALNYADGKLYYKKSDGTTIASINGVTQVTATGPILSSGGTAPVISMAAASTTTSGYLTTADWDTFNSKQDALGFTPYNASNPAGYVTGGGTASGTNTGDNAVNTSYSGLLASQTAATVYAAPTLAAGTPSFRVLTLEDLPDAWVKKSVVVATTANITLSAVQTIDGIVLVAGDRVLVKDQTTTSTNGIYVVSASAWARSLDANTISKLAGAHVNVDKGTTNGGISFDTDTKTTDTLGTTAVIWNRNVDTGYTIPIAQGGTGAITAAAALTALGAYASNNPSGYTSSTGTVTSVGGTGSYGGLTLTGSVTTTGNLTLGGTPTGSWPISVTGSSASTTGNAATATSLINGSAGTIPYQTAASTTAMLAAGTSGYVLRSNGAAAPSWALLDMTYLPDSALKKSVRCATTVNITLSAPQTIDGIAVIAGDRVLVKNQTLPATNGIYTVAAGAWTRPAGTDSSSEMGGAFVAVDTGTVGGGDLWTTTFKTTDVVGTTAMNWYEIVYNTGTWGISTTGSAATLTTPRTLTLGSTGKTFDGSANVAWTLAEIGAYAATNPSGYTTNTGTVTSVTATAPVASSGGTAPVISMAAASTTTSGYLTSTDWTTFNNKLTLSSAITGYVAGTNTALAATDTLVAALGKIQGQVTARSGTVTGVTATAPVVSSGGTAPIISMAAANTTVNGYLTTGDWDIFNNKIDLSSAITGYVAGTNTVLASTDTLVNSLGKIQGQITARITLSSAITGYVAGTNTALAATDTLVAALGKIQGQITARSGTVTGVTATAPIASSGGTAPVISLANTAVTAGAYTTANITVDAQGRITAAANGTAAAPSIGSVGSYLMTGASNSTTAYTYGSSYTGGTGTSSNTLGSACMQLSFDASIGSSGVWLPGMSFGTIAGTWRWMSATSPATTTNQHFGLAVRIA